MNDFFKAFKKFRNNETWRALIYGNKKIIPLTFNMHPPPPPVAIIFFFFFFFFSERVHLSGHSKASKQVKNKMDILLLLKVKSPITIFF